MNLSYRTPKNAEAIARFWGKSLDKSDWYRIDALSDNEAEILIYDIIGFPFNDAAEMIRTLSEMKQGKITVRINSPGGDVFDAMAIFNALQSHKSKIVTRIESLAASSASFIALAGKEVQAYQNAMVMIHEPWSYSAGNQYDLREVADILEKISGNMVDIYAQNTNVGKREWRDLMKAETWWTAKEAKEKGFVDTILDGKSVANAAFDLSMFANVPDEIKDDSSGQTILTGFDVERILKDGGAPKAFAKKAAAACRASGLFTRSHAEGETEIDPEKLDQLSNILTGGEQHV